MMNGFVPELESRKDIVDKGQASVEMSVHAINQILNNKSLDPKEIDAIIVGTVTPDMLFPSCAALIQNEIGAINAWGYDLSAACSGFLFALESGASLIETGKAYRSNWHNNRVTSISLGSRLLLFKFDLLRAPTFLN